MCFYVCCNSDRVHLFKPTRTTHRRLRSLCVFCRTHCTANSNATVVLKEASHMQRKSPAKLRTTTAMTMFSSRPRLRTSVVRSRSIVLSFCSPVLLASIMVLFAVAGKSSRLFLTWLRILKKCSVLRLTCLQTCDVTRPAIRTRRSSYTNETPYFIRCRCFWN